MTSNLQSGNSFSLPFRPHFPSKSTLIESNTSDHQERGVLSQHTLRESAEQKPKEAEFRIIVEENQDYAIAFAKQEYDEDSPINNKLRAVFWANAVHNGRGPAVGVVYKTSRNNFVWKQYQITSFVFLHTAKAMAIEKALESAWEICNSTEEKPSTVVVYTDSAAALKTILNTTTKTAALRASSCRAFANRLKQMGINVELRWVPAHSTLQGLERSRAASRVREKFAGLKSGPLSDMVDITDPKMKKETNKKTIYMARATVQGLLAGLSIESVADGQLASSKGSSSSSDHLGGTMASTLPVQLERMNIDE